MRETTHSPEGGPALFDADGAEALPVAVATATTVVGGRVFPSTVAVTVATAVDVGPAWLTVAIPTGVAELVLTVGAALVGTFGVAAASTVPIASAQ